MTHADPSRFDHEGETRVSSYERDEAGEKVAKLEALIEKFKLEAQAFAEGVKLIDKNFIDLWERSTRKKTASHAEQIAGFVELVDDTITELIDQGEVERLKLIAETGRDE